MPIFKKTAKARTQMTCERIDDDEVVVRLTNLGLDYVWGDQIEDIEIRLAFYEDTECLEVNIETIADSTITAEFRRSGDINLRFDDVPNPCLKRDGGVCERSCDCKCDTGQCDCNGDYDDECECCGDTPCASDCDEFCQKDAEEDDGDCKCSGHSDYHSSLTASQMQHSPSG